MELVSIIEGILYFKGQPVTVKDLVKMTQQSESVVRAALDQLRERLEGHGIAIVMNENTVELCTVPELADMIQKLQKEELEKPLSKASIETLAIVAYSDGITRSEIDYIRGVNSTFILRSLEIRGLVEKKTHPDDKRTMLYYPTIDFLKSVGADQVTSLPDYAGFQDKVTILKQEGLSSEEE